MSTKGGNGGRIDSDLRATVSSLVERVETLETQNEQLSQQVDALETENARLRETIDKEQSERDTSRKMLAKLTGRINTLEESGVSGASGGENDESATSDEGSPTDGDGADRDESEAKTPMHRVLSEGSGSGISITPSVDRAQEIMKHWKQWSTKTPKGRFITDNLKTLMETATGEDLAWKQVYRACKKVEALTKGILVFVDLPNKGKCLKQTRAL